MSTQLDFIATAAFGLEAVVARELKHLGYGEHSTEDGRVTFRADEAAVSRANLWLRSADRLLIKLGEFPAYDFGVLFDRTEALPWEEWISSESAFPVYVRSVRSQLHSVPDCQAIVKKAVVERLKKHHAKDWFEESGPEVAIDVSIRKDVVTVSVDTSGAGLHKRGYRQLVGHAPIKETLAAALVQLSYWNRERPLVDPFCGSGTIPIEAALIARNIAPGLNRSFAAEHWARFPAQMWADARTEASDAVQPDPEFTLIGTDIDSQVLSLARHHAERADVADNIHFQQKAFTDFTTSRKYGCIICNPPYGERSGDVESAEKLYREMGQVLKSLDTWSIYVLTSHPKFESIFGRTADRRRKLYNGRIACTYYQYFGPPPPRPRPEQIE